MVAFKAVYWPVQCVHAAAGPTCWARMVFAMKDDLKAAMTGLIIILSSRVTPGSTCAAERVFMLKHCAAVSAFVARRSWQVGTGRKPCTAA